MAECTYSQLVSSQDRFVNESAHDERSSTNNQPDFSHERTDFDTTNYSHADSIAECTYSQPVSSQDRFVNENAHDERSFFNENEGISIAESGQRRHSDNHGGETLHMPIVCSHPKLCQLCLAVIVCFRHFLATNLSQVSQICCQVLGLWRLHPAQRLHLPLQTRTLVIQHRPQRHAQ